MAEATTIESIISIIDDLLKLLDKKKSKDKRNQEKDKIHDKIMDITDMLLEMNKNNAKLPPDPNEVKRIEEAQKEWDKFKKKFRDFVKYHNEDKDDEAKDQLSQSKVHLAELKEILEKIDFEKKYRVRRQEEEANKKAAEEKRKSGNKK